MPDWKRFAFRRQCRLHVLPFSNTNCLLLSSLLKTRHISINKECLSCMPIATSAKQQPSCRHTGP